MSKESASNQQHLFVDTSFASISSYCPYMSTQGIRLIFWCCGGHNIMPMICQLPIPRIRFPNEYPRDMKKTMIPLKSWHIHQFQCGLRTKTLQDCNPKCGVLARAIFVINLSLLNIVWTCIFTTSGNIEHIVNCHIIDYSKMSWMRFMKVTEILHFLR